MAAECVEQTSRRLLASTQIRNRRADVLAQAVRATPATAPLVATLRPADETRAAGAAGRAGLVASFDDLGRALIGATAESLADEVERRGPSWRLHALAPALAGKPVLTIFAAEGLARDNKALVTALQRAGASKVTAVELESDHSFADKRITMSAEVVRWLQGLR